MQAEGHPKLKRNILANYAGTFWTAVTSLVAIPFLVRLLGISGFGLVGFYIALQSVVALLDAGMSTTLNRQMTSMTVARDSPRQLRDLVRTMELVYWGIAVSAALAIAVLAPIISGGWLKGVNGTSLHWDVVLIGIAIAVEFPSVLYAGGLMGLRRQVELNLVVIVSATLRSFGSVLVLWMVAPTIEAFLIWQIVAGLAQSASSAILLWWSLPDAPCRPRFRVDLLKRVGRFSSAIAAISVLGALLTQLPRLELSALLTAKAFGYFSLAAVLVTGLYGLITPVFQGVFPRLTELSALKDEESLGRLYHQSCQLASVIVMPVGVVMIFFGRQALQAWTGSSTTASAAGLVLTLLAVGTLMHTLYWMPHALQLAQGWTSLALYQNAAAVIILVPATWFLALRWGAVGASIAWIILNAGYLSIGVYAMHRRVLPGHRGLWYRFDLLAPLAATVAVPSLAWLLTNEGTVWPSDRVVSMGLIASIVAGSGILALLSAATTRDFVKDRLLPVLIRRGRPALGSSA